jgi:hypothetical protein
MAALDTFLVPYLHPVSEVPPADSPPLVPAGFPRLVDWRNVPLLDALAARSLATALPGKGKITTRVDAILDDLTNGNVTCLS